MHDPEFVKIRAGTENCRPAASGSPKSQSRLTERQLLTTPIPTFQETRYTNHTVSSKVEV